MTTVLVTGATGVLGRSMLARPAASGHRVWALSRRATAGATAGVRWLRANLATGAGLAEAVAGAEVIVHAASDPRGDTARTDVEGTRRLLVAAREAGVEHFVYVSIVGVDRIPFGYYRHKLAAEGVVRDAGVPWTVVRGTQFHDFMDSLVRPMARLPIGIAPSGFLGQPVHVDEFADVLWRRVAEGPVGRAPDVGGPEVLTYAEMVRQWCDARGVRKRVLELPIPGRAAAAMRRGDGTAPQRAVGRLTWAAWTRARYAR